MLSFDQRDRGLGSPATGTGLPPAFLTQALPNAGASMGGVRKRTLDSRQRLLLDMLDATPEAEVHTLLLRLRRCDVERYVAQRDLATGQQNIPRCRNRADIVARLSYLGVEAYASTPSDTESSRWKLRMLRVMRRDLAQRLTVRA